MPVLDDFLDLLSPQALEWLLIIAICPEPRFSMAMISAKAIRDKIEDAETVQTGYQEAVNELTALSLINARRDGPLSIHPLVVFQLMDNRESRFLQNPDIVAATQKAFGVFFYSLAKKTKERPQKVRILMRGIEPVLAQGDIELVNAYLHSCAAVFFGFVPVSVFLDIILRAEPMLIQTPDQEGFYTIAFCAQTLTEMRDFSNATKLYNRMLENDKLPEEMKGLVYGPIGTIYLMQRKWDEALKNYHTAIQWFEKTGNHVAMGTSYHQIGGSMKSSGSGMRPWKTIRPLLNGRKKPATM